MSGPLTGLRVIELAHVMAGPTCGRLLADLGAEVIKIEKPPYGDDTRKMAPPYVGPNQDEAAAFLIINHNKRALGLDLKQDAGRQVLERLLASADVLIENFRKGTLEKLGFSSERLHALNPRLIICAISGFGRSGPYADRGGFDLMAQGIAGLLSITGEGPGRPPVKPGVAVADIGAGLYATIAVLAALVERQRSGRGQCVEASLLESAVAFTVWHTAIFQATGVNPPPTGTAHPLDAPYQAFEASDGWLTVGGANQSTWLKLVDALERPDLAADARFRENPDRVANLPALIAALAPVFKSRSVTEWLGCLEAHGVPAGPVNTIAQMVADPQLAARGMLRTVEHPRAGPVTAIAPPMKFSAHPELPLTPAPQLGEQTDAVLTEYGFSDAERAALRASGAVF
jgi:crotonobetainyl-CoA:carnitine CoA-transferase CaiB-like acyl-CoA transferase